MVGDLQIAAEFQNPEVSVFDHLKKKKKEFNHAYKVVVP